RVAPRPHRVRGIQRRRRHVVAAAPERDLPFAVLMHGFGLVQALQRSVHALVPAPGVLDGAVHLLELFERDPERRDRALEHLGARQIEAEALGAQELAGAACFDFAIRAERHVHPAGEAIFLVPLALAVAEQDERLHGQSPSQLENGKKMLRPPINEMSLTTLSTPSGARWLRT